MRQATPNEGEAMKVRMIGLGVSGGVAVMVAGFLLLATFGACSKNNQSWDDGGAGYTILPDGNKVPNAQLGNANPEGGNGNGLVMIGMAMPDAGSDGGMSGPAVPMAIGTI